jgi:hypothetical protein
MIPSRSSLSPMIASESQQKSLTEASSLLPIVQACDFFIKVQYVERQNVEIKL